MEENKSLNKEWIIVIIVGVAVVAFAAYFWSNPAMMTEDKSASMPMQDMSQKHMEDSASVIEADLKGLKMDDLGSELSDIEKELAQ